MDLRKWMGTLSILEDVPLRRIAMPGSHDAGTWAVSSIEGLSYVRCQDKKIYDQLEFGSRYLDLRAEWRPHAKIYQIYHGTYPLVFYASTTLDDALSDVERFLKNYETETVRDGNCHCNHRY